MKRTIFLLLTVVAFLSFFRGAATASSDFSASLQNCTPVVGTLGAARYYTVGGLKSVGSIRVSLGYTCPVWSGKNFSLIAGGVVGSYLDKQTTLKTNYEDPNSTTESQQIVGLMIGVDYEAKGQASVGGAWECGKPIDRANAYMVMFSYTIPLEYIWNMGTKLAGSSD